MQLNAFISFRIFKELLRIQRLDKRERRFRETLLKRQLSYSL